MVEKFTGRVIALTVLVAFNTSLHAQDLQAQVEDIRFPTNLLEPAPGPSNFMAVESPEIGRDKKPSVGVVTSYQMRPFVTFACDADNNCGDDVASDVSQVQGTIDNVKHVVVSDILFGFSFLKRFQAGIAVPVYVFQTGDQTDVVYNGSTGEYWLRSDNRYRAYGVLGDIRLHLKARLMGDPSNDGVMISAAIVPTIPLTTWTGQGNNEMGQSFTGSESVTVTPKAMAQWRKGPFRIIANAGFKFRKKIQYYSAEYGHAITFSGGAGYLLPIKPEVFDIEFFAEVYGEKNVVSSNFLDIDSVPLLYDGGARFGIGDFSVSIAAGGGIISGIGVPQFQGMLAVTWTPTDRQKPRSRTRQVARDEASAEPETCSDELKYMGRCLDDSTYADEAMYGTGVPTEAYYCVRESKAPDDEEFLFGCADRSEAFVTIRNRRFVPKVAITFEPLSSQIANPDTLHPILDVVAVVLSQNDTWKLTVDVRQERFEEDVEHPGLSQERAERIKAYLVGQGAPADRIDAIGRGPEYPLAPNDPVALRLSDPQSDARVTASPDDGYSMDFTEDGGEEEAEVEMDFMVDEDENTMDFDTD